MKKHLITWFGMVMAACLLLSLTLAGCGSTAAVSNPALKTAVNSAPATPDTIVSAAPAKGPQEGIKVHGHWTIEVTNPDGTLAESREFENAIDAEGSGGLCNILARAHSVGAWAIVLNKNYVSGYICESTMPTSGLSVSKNLSVTITSNGKLEFSGTINAWIDWEIDDVTTEVCALPSTSPPSSQYTNDTFSLTSTTLVDKDTHEPKPVKLTTGQQLTVDVVISFS